MSTCPKPLGHSRRIKYRVVKVVATAALTLFGLSGSIAHAGCAGWLGWWQNRGFDPAATSALARAEVRIDPAWWTALVAAGRADRIWSLRLTDGRDVRIGRPVGRGREGFVFCLNHGCTRVIKLARHVLEPGTVTAESARAAELTRAGFDVVSILSTQQLGVPYVIKAFAPGPSFARALGRGLSAAQIDALADIYLKGLRTGVHPDLMGADRANLFWNADRRRWVFVDAGPESAPAFYQPFGVMFRAGGRVTTTLLVYLEDVFENRRAEADQFHAAVQKRLSTPD